MNTKKSALLVVDMQKNVVANGHDRHLVIANINDLVSRARASGAPVIWVQHSNEEMKMHTEGWQIVDELKPLPGEVVIHKIHGDSFEETDLEAKLRGLQVGRLIVTGAQTDACIRSTIHGAFARGYDTVLVSDAHTTEDLTSYGLPSPQKLIEFTNIYWTWQTGANKKASVEKASAVAFCTSL
jgi:nicotinamidase-related amidase